MKIVAALFALALVAGCTKEGVKAGDPCNGPGSCKAPLTCYESSKGSFCGSSCGMEMGKRTCPDPSLEPVETTVNGLAAGCACLPK